MKRTLSICILFVISSFIMKAQTVVDGIIAIIGKEIILQSDFDKTYAEYAAQFAVQDEDEQEKCTVLEHLVFTKLMLHQADVDSIIVSDQQVEATMNARMNYFLQKTGGDPRVIEKHFGKSMAEIKNDLREIVRDQLYVEEVQESITSKVTVTPSEVKAFVNKYGVDSMQLIPSTYEFGHIVKTPTIGLDEIEVIKARLESFREQALRSGNVEQQFGTFAVMYSDDPGSALKRGNLGFVERGALYPEFESVAFNLKSGEISHVVKTRAGYHIIMLIERRGDAVNVAHILLQPKPSQDEQVKAIEYLDSVRKVILDKKMDFSDAALAFSDDPNKLSGGWVINPYTLSTKFDQETMEPGTFATVNKLISGEYSTPVIYNDEDGVVSYRLIYLKNKVAPHKANLVEDYDVIKNDALEEKKGNVIEKWILNKVKTTSIQIKDKYKTCDFVIRWQIN